MSTNGTNGTCSDAITAASFSSTSAGFIFGCVFGTLLLVVCLAVLAIQPCRGPGSNEDFVFHARSVERRVPGPALTFRVACLVVALCGLAYTYNGSFGPNIASQLRYYTNWNFILVSSYFAVASVLSAWLFGRPDSAVASNGHWFRLNVALKLLGEIEVPNSLLVTLVYWIVLYNPGTDATSWDFTNVVTHLMNALMIFTDFFFIASYRFNPKFCVAPLALAAFYVIATLIWSQAAGFVAYSFLNTDCTAYIVWIIGLAILILLLFFGFYAVGLLKLRFILGDDVRAKMEPSDAAGELGAANAPGEHTAADGGATPSFKADAAAPNNSMSRV
jgi:hypothetical protein